MENKLLFVSLGNITHLIGMEKHIYTKSYTFTFTHGKDNIKHM